MKKTACVTIFTPTFNRGELLHVLYNSIVKQKDVIDIEWLIVDDGSTDCTKDEINRFVAEGEISIRYYYQDNQGKHVAINNGVEYASGEFFFIVDSDDRLADDALYTIGKWIKSLPNDYAGVGGLRIMNNGDTIGTSFGQESLDCTSLERERNNIKGDKAEVFRTSLLKKYKFPVINGEKFMTEAVVWNRIARDGYKIRWINEPLIICEYRKDGLTNNRLSIRDKNYKGYLLYLKELAEQSDGWIARNKCRAAYYEIAKNHLSDSEVTTNLNINNFTLLMLKMLVLAKGIIK